LSNPSLSGLVAYLVALPLYPPNKNLDLASLNSRQSSGPLSPSFPCVSTPRDSPTTNRANEPNVVLCPRPFHSFIFSYFSLLSDNVSIDVAPTAPTPDRRTRALSLRERGLDTITLSRNTFPNSPARDILRYRVLVSMFSKRVAGKSHRDTCEL
jgi:hypothetical protein